MARMRKLIWAAIAVLFVIPASAQVHRATPLDVLLVRLGVTHDHHHHDMAGMPSMQWDGSAVTTDAVSAPQASVMAARPDATTKTFTIVARQFEFDITPSPFVVNAGDDVTLNISVPSNDGSSVGHGFFLENYMSNQLPIARGKSVSVHFIAAVAGTFTYLCTVTCGDGHPGMNGIMTVNAQAAAPVVSSISPTSGPSTGGTRITVTGSNFVEGATVKIAGIAATNVTVVSATTITATTPAFAPTEQLVPPKDVVVTNPDGQSTTLSGAFTYTMPALTVTFIDPSGATPAGGVTVTIIGSGFATALVATVTFGGVAATNVTVLSTNAMRATVPAHNAGTVDVTIAAGSSTATLTSGFTYGTPPPRRRSARHQ